MRRARSLAALYTYMLGDVSPTLQVKIARTAELVAIAEATRAAHLRGESSAPLDDLVRVERLAAAAVKQLGIADRKPVPQPSLQEYLASRTGNVTHAPDALPATEAPAAKQRIGEAP